MCYKANVHSKNTFKTAMKEIKTKNVSEKLMDRFYASDVQKLGGFEKCQWKSVFKESCMHAFTPRLVLGVLEAKSSNNQELPQLLTTTLSADKLQLLRWLHWLNQKLDE